VYDVTPYIDEHPGGDAILNNAGADSTEGFNKGQHPEHVRQTMMDFVIGVLKN
jgi:cytochrome b involved in lipid metabolism